MVSPSTDDASGMLRDFTDYSTQILVPAIFFHYRCKGWVCCVAPGRSHTAAERSSLVDKPRNDDDEHDEDENEDGPRFCWGGMLYEPDEVEMMHGGIPVQLNRNSLIRIIKTSCESWCIEALMMMHHPFRA